MEISRPSCHARPAGTLVRHAVEALLGFPHAIPSARSAAARRGVWGTLAILAALSLGCRQEVCFEPITIEPISIRIEVDVRQTQGQQANSPMGSSRETIEKAATGADPNAPGAAWLPAERHSTHG